MRPAYVREANVLWSKTIWRMIDLREKQNLRLFYPTKPIDERRSLFTVLIDAINKGDLAAYSSATENEFEKRLSEREVYDSMGDFQADSIEQVNPETGLTEWRYIYDQSALPSDLVKKFLVKEVWFFDRKYGRMNVRIIGLCPILEVENGDHTRLDMKMTFWVYYPDAAQFLSEQEAFSFTNDAQRQSIYDVLEQRAFGSYVFRESNVYDNRVINTYAQGMSQNIEAERIKSELFQKEHDMWEF